MYYADVYDDGPTSSLTVRTTHYEDDRTTHRLPKAGEEWVSTYVEAVNILLKLYATDSNIAKAASETTALRKIPMVTPV